MALNVVLVSQRQSPAGLALTWSAMEGVASYEIFVATRKLAPEELEAAQLLGGTDECQVAKVGSEVHSVVDDVTPQGEARFYGVAMMFNDGAVKAARFKAVPDGATAESFQLSAIQGRAAPKAAAPRSAAAPAASVAPAATVTPISFPSVAEGEDPLEARKRAQREARERATAGAASERPADAVRIAAPAAAAPAAAAPAGAVSGAAAPAAAEPPPPPSSVPLAEPLELRMQGATQTWDGLRLYWDREPRAAAYEIVASDHQLFGDELADALAGIADFTTAVAVAPAVTCVIDNVTAREARGWYAVLARFRDGRRAAHPFLVGDAATSGKTAAPFLNPNRTGELRGEVEELLGQAQEQWERWSAEQDGGARREARRLIGDALLIWPNHPAAKRLSEQMG
jgi:hypothetical protein